MAEATGTALGTSRARLVWRRPIWLFVPLAALLGLAPALIHPIIMIWAALAYGFGLWTFAQALRTNPHRGRVEVFARSVGLGLLGSIGAGLTLFVDITVDDPNLGAQTAEAWTGALFLYLAMQVYAVAFGFVWGAFAGAWLAFLGFRYEAAGDAISVETAVEGPHVSRNEP